MRAEQRGSEPVREVRLEGFWLSAVGGVLVAVMVGAFFAGRWYERQFHPVDPAELSASDPLRHVADAKELQAADVTAEADYFDNLEGGEKELEPAREVRSPTPAPRSTPTPAESSPAASNSSDAATESGDYFVQVFAGRDQAAVAGLVKKLEGEGRRVKLVTDREGQGTLYKVQVGGYASETQARTAAGDLRQQGYAGAWVVHAD